VSSKPPRLSIGLPVYNAERFLSEAIESLLNQSFDDFELIICDNASTDATEALSRRFAERDKRVRYYKNETNVGAAPNFNKTFELARGDYFKWMAGDDCCGPDFLARCVEVLDRDPGVVLAYPGAMIIDENSAEVERYDLNLATDSDRPSRRYGAMLRGHACYEVFGVIRRDALAGTALMGSYSFGDRVLLARLALMGRFFEIPEPLFLARRHDGQSMTMLDDRRRYAVWFDSRLENRKLFPHWRLYFELLRSIHQTSNLAFSERLRAYRKVIRRAYWSRRELGEDLSYHLRARATAS
jgi:glycosyltransferase involved in cell wall biosynthesis